MQAHAGRRADRRSRPATATSKTKLATGKLLTVDNQIDTDHRHGQAQGRVRQRGRRAVSEPVRQRAHAGRDADATRRSCRRRRSSAARRARSSTSSRTTTRSRVTPVKLGPAQGEITAIASGRRAGRRWWSSTAPTSCAKARRSKLIDARRASAAQPAPAARPRGDGAGERRGGNGAPARTAQRAGDDRRAQGDDAGTRERPRTDARNATAARCADEPVAPLHPAAGRDLAADGGDPARRASSRTALLPLSALPQVDYPTIQVVTLYPGASPDVMTSSVTAPLERQFGQMPGLNQMSSTSSGGASVITLQFSLDADARRRRAGGAGGDQRGRQPAADRPADAADLQQGQSGRRADPDAGADVDDAAAAARSRTWSTRASRRRSRSCPASAWSASAAASARRCASRPTRRRWPRYGLTLDDVRTAIAQRQRQPGEGQLRRPDARVDDRRQRPAASRPTSTSSLIIAYQQRRAGARSPTSPTSSTAPRTRGSPRGRTTTPAVIVNIQRQPGANVIEVVDRVKQLLPQLQATLPAVGRRARC